MTIWSTIVSAFTEPEPQVEPIPVMRGDPITAARTSADKVDFHISRFTRAIEQCERPEKRQDLERNLAYWQAIRDARSLLEGEG
jgi:hypothetical protein